MTQKQDIVDELQGFIKKVDPTPGKTVSKLCDEVIQIIPSSLREMINNPLETIQRAWNVNVLQYDELTFEECLRLIKTELDPEKHKEGVCIFKVTKNSLDVKDGYKYEIYIYFMGKDENGKDTPLLDGSEPHWVIECKKIDQDLKENFDDKDLILVK